ncbi:hypothetical protein FXO38_30574 [Capsicum annuum]|nr:hypothetical protein FXO38_30574 [Capsicum annuum]KAF3644418.1 hypothetical protein FXO37_21470 [Capsicum annuum]
MLLAKDPSKKVDSDHIMMTLDLEFSGGYPWGKESFGLTLSYLKKKTDLTKQKEAFVKRNNASYTLFGFFWAFLVWIYDFFPYLERYTGVTILTSSVEVADEDEDLGCHHYVPSPSRACDHADSSGLKTALDASNGDDLREHVALLEKNLLDIDSFVRDERPRRIEKNKKKKQDKVHLDSSPRSHHKVNLEELAVAVMDIAAADEKVELQKKEEETKEENATDEQDAKEEEEEEKEEEEEEEEEEKDEEMTVEEEEENEEKTKEDGEKKSSEEEYQNEKAVDED